jgi:GNAT superfamily N-acetyltransferase
LRVRGATAGDLDLVLHHRLAMFRAMGFRDEGALGRMQDSSRPFFAAGLREGWYQGFFVEDDEGQVVSGGGVVLLEYQPHPDSPGRRRPFVVNMYTEPAWQGRGLARALLRAMVEWCRGEGHSFLYLHASESGRRLYESFGFQPTNEMRLRL